MKKKVLISQTEFSSSLHTPVSFFSVRASPVPKETFSTNAVTCQTPEYTSTTLHKSKRPSIDTYVQGFSGKQLGSAESVSKLKQILGFKEKQIQILETENKRLLKLKDPEKWEKELVKRNEEVRKLEYLVNYYKDLLSNGCDSTKLLQIIDSQSRKISELEFVVGSLSDQNLEKFVLELESENNKLKKQLQTHNLAVQEFESLKSRYSELEKEFKITSKERISLLEEVTKLKTDTSKGSFLSIVQDIYRVRKEVNKLLKIIEDIHKGKEISLRGLLGFEVEKFQEPSLQLFSDVQKLKSDLSKILSLISDLHASNSADHMCKTQ